MFLELDLLEEVGRAVDGSCETAELLRELDFEAATIDLDHLDLLSAEVLGVHCLVKPHEGTRANSVDSLGGESVFAIADGSQKNVEVFVMETLGDIRDDCFH